MVKRIIYPPIWLVLSLITIFALNELMPGIRFTSSLGQIMGGLIILIGLVLLLLAGGLFKRAGTDLVPFKNVSALVTTGIYRYTRNPMYLGMTAILLGCGITVGAALSLLVAPVFMVIIEWRFIRLEEEMLRGLFPEDFPPYCARVRRWL
ncbi:MAG: protein-S-isoprenylcysteine O-methyltransferase Ste14 [Halioglobus sp.]|jgi:protein-S-isoprenylcysteine O-methyltransferase Ste14